MTHAGLKPTQRTCAHGYLNTCRVATTMFNKGEPDLSRARGAKAQRRQQQQYQAVENTINFRPQHKPQQRPIELIPKSRAQEQLVFNLLDNTISINVALGPAGTGKSYLAMLAAMRALRIGACEKIILTRPAVGVEDEKHGFLPGNLVSKMEPWTRPLLDIMKEFYHPKDVNRMIEEETIEISPLAFMRGRTFKNAWIVADEMQNATPNQMKMLLTRIGSGSHIIVTGDVEQTDKSHVQNGLLDLADKLEKQPTPGIKITRLGTTDIQRHPIIDQVLQLYP